MNCPICNKPNCEEIADEVDIGVGIQKYVYGYECQDCGQLSICHSCGGIEEHNAWCPILKESK